MKRLLIASCITFLLASCAPMVRYSPSEIQDFPPKIQEHIKNGKITLGMTTIQVRYAWGAPNSVNIRDLNDEGHLIEEWIYARLRVRGTKLVFTDGELTDIETGITRSDSDKGQRK